MDYEAIKVFVPVLSGLLAFVGGLLSFLNGRLNEASTEEKRSSVINTLLLSFFSVLNVCALLVVIFTRAIYSIPLNILSLATITIAFVRLKDPLSRAELVAICAFYCMTFSLVGGIINDYYTSRLLHQIDLLATARERTPR